MCIGIPMQVLRVDDAGSGHVLCQGRGEQRRIATLLVGQCAPGDWLLTFLDDARERIDATRAAEINAVLDLLAHALDGRSTDMALDFALPSATSAAELDASLGGHSTSSTESLP